MSKKKAAKLPAKGKSSAEIIEGICQGITSLAEGELRSTRAWEEWIRQAAEEWVLAHQKALASGTTSSGGLREAMATAKERAAALARDWATGWFGSRGDAILTALPTQEAYAESARALTERTGLPPADPPQASAATDGECSEWLESFEKLVKASTQAALEHRFSADMSSGEKFKYGGAQLSREADKKGWQDSFVADAVRSMTYVRSTIVATALTVVQQTAYERGRALSDTVSRRLALDSTCGRLEETMTEIRQSKARSQAAAAAETADDAEETSIFWREVRRDAAKVLDKSDVRRLVTMHV